MIPQQWTLPCNNQCTQKYAALIQIPYEAERVKRFLRNLIQLLIRCMNGESIKDNSNVCPYSKKGRVFCKKGCDSDGDTWEDCLGECDEICYKDPVLKNRQWSAYIDRSPGAASYSEECFRACVAGCGYKFDLPSEKVNQVHSKRPLNPSTVEKPPAPSAIESRPPREFASADDVPSISA